MLLGAPQAPRISILSSSDPSLCSRDRAAMAVGKGRWCSGVTRQQFGFWTVFWKLLSLMSRQSAGDKEGTRWLWAPLPRLDRMLREGRVSQHFPVTHRHHEFLEQYLLRPFIKGLGSREVWESRQLGRHGSSSGTSEVCCSQELPMVTWGGGTMT